MVIDVSSATCGSSSTTPIGATQQNFPCTGTVYQFDLMLFYNPDHKFDIDDAEAKLFALMKSPHAVDGCNWFNTELIKLSPVTRKGVGPSFALRGR
jgi:hypothetical protein